MHSLRLFREFLTTVPPRVADPQRRRQSRLLAQVLLVVVPLGSLSLGLQLLAIPGFATTLRSVLPGLAILVIAFGLNRRGHYLVAATLTVAATAIAALAALAVSPEDDFAFAYLGVSLLLAALFLTPRQLLGFALTVLVGVLAVSQVAHDRTVIDIVTALLFIATVTSLLWVMLRHREQLEHERRAQLVQREARYRNIVETAQEGIWEIDTDSKTVFVNPTMAAMLGYRVEEMLGRSLFDFMDAQGRALAVAYVERRKAGIAEQHEFKFQRRDGSAVWTLINTNPLPGPAGSYAGALAMVSDITDRKRAEQGLRESEALLAKAEEVAQVGSFSWDLVTNAVQWSRQAYRLFGVDPDGPRPDVWRILEERLHPDDKPKLAASIERIRSEARRTPMELRVLLPDGAERTLWSDGEFILDASGRPQRMVGTFQDISARKRIELALHESEQRFRALIERSVDGIVLLTDDGRITYQSPTVAQILGYPPGALLQHHAHEYVHPDDQEVVAAMLAEIGQTPGAIQKHQARVRHQDGSWRVLEGVFTNLLAVPGVNAIVNNFRDITDRVAAETALRESEMRLSEAQAIAQLGSWELDLVTQDLHWSDEIYRIFELDPSQFTSSYAAFLARVHPDDRAAVDRAFAESVANRSPYSITHRLRMPDGRIKTVHEQGQTYYDGAGKPLRSIGTVQDVTERKQAEARMQQLSRAVEQTADSIVITDKRGAIEYVNQAFEQITGYSAAEALGQTPRLVKSGVHDAEFYRRLWATIERGEVFRDVVVNRRRNGELYFEEKTITPLRDDAGEITHYVSTGKDITERMQVQERLQYLAHHDALTELPNRVLFMDRLSQALTRAQWHERVVAVLFLDLDRFKYINDTFGHNVGDKFLQHMAARLKSCVREGDTVARLGGDEFALLLEDVGQVADIAPVADKLLAALAAPFVLEGREFFVTTSIGISLYPADGVDGQTLLKHADTAMYRAKDLGRNNYQFYSADLSAKAFERLTLETSLRRALERDEFLLYYQPQVDIRAQRLIGLEVLLRWRHPELGVVSPTQFIPVAEETGLIVPIGEWVLRSACAQARAWRAAGLAFGSITVNLSGRQFADPALAARIGQVLSDTGLAAGLLELEITESVVMHDPQSAVHTLEQLNAMGIRIAIDDFGTGYSSLAYLKRYPIDTLKVDQSFVRDVTHDPNDASIVQAIIAMARSMQLRVVAEGVETEEQLTFLRTHGCEAVQGYLFSRPVPAEEARELIARNRFSSTPARAR